MESTLDSLLEVYQHLKNSVTWREVLVYASIGGSTYYLYKILVKPFLSPLRQIPGPQYKPIVGNMYDALRSEAMSNTIMWMMKYKSKIVRYYFFYGEGRVLVADPHLVKQISVTNSKNYTRLTSSYSALRVFAKEFVLFTNDLEHYALRRVMNPAFNMKTIESFIPVFTKCTDQVVTMWKERVQENGKFAKVDAQMVMARLTLDLICECGFDYKLHAVEDPTSAGVHSFRRILQGTRLRLMQILPFFRSLPTKENKQLWKDSKIFKSTIQNMIQQRRSQVNDTKLGHDTEHRGDLMSILFQAKDEKGNHLPDNIIFDQIAGFLFAGYETTSTLLTWTLLLLSEQPDVQNKLRDEIKAVVQDTDKQLALQDLDKMNYLNCVIKESLRLYPPASTLFRRARCDDYLGGYFIPAGTIVGIGIGALHRHPDNWEDPNTFKPERFQEEINPYKFQPFTSGPFMCIGHRFAMTEAKVILVTLLRNFRFELVPGYTYRRVRYLTIQPHPPLVLNVFRV